jgi:hypothetical protein
MKNDKDNYLLPRWRQDTKNGKTKEVKAPREILIVLHHLIIVGGFFITIIVVVAAGSSTRGAYAKSGQLSRN